MQSGPYAHRRQIRNYLLDRRFQLGYTLIIVVISSLLSAGLGYFWYDEMRRASRLVEVQALGSMAETDAVVLEDALATQDQKRLLVLVAFGVIVATVLAGYGIIFTHKTAGPLFKIQRHFGEIKDGRLPELRDLRRGDQLHDFWIAFREMVGALREQTQREADELEAVLAAGDSPASETLRAMRDRKRAALGQG